MALDVKNNPCGDLAALGNLAKNHFVSLLLENFCRIHMPHVQVQLLAAVLKMLLAALAAHMIQAGPCHSP